MQNSKLQFKIQNFTKFFFFFLPIIKFKVKEKSMEPAIKEGSILFISRYHYLFRKPKVGEIIILRDPTNVKRFIIKRVEETKGNKVFVVGDNRSESIDSRQFGWIEINNIIGKVL